MTSKVDRYNQLSSVIHADNAAAGWWDNPDECIYQKLQLVSTEIAEATEGARKSLMDTHLPNRKMEEVEYADAMIRILDIGGKLDLMYHSDSITPRWCNSFNSVGMQHLGINEAIVDMGRILAIIDNEVDKSIRKTMGNLIKLDEAYSSVINAISKVALNRSCALFTAIEEKRSYNKTRTDHKRENRVKPDGKKF
jgi:hypothetical protein